MATKSTSTTARNQDDEMAPVDLFGQIKRLGESLGIMAAHQDDLNAPSLEAAGEIGTLIFGLALRGEQALMGSDQEPAEVTRTAKNSSRSGSVSDLEGPICDIHSLLAVARDLFVEMHNFQTWSPKATHEELRQEDENFGRAFCVLAAAQKKADELHDLYFAEEEAA